MTTDTSAEDKIGKAQGMALVELARKTIMEKFGETPSREVSVGLENKLKDDCFQKNCGTFVTLKLNNCLRGCIGSLAATEPIVSGVKSNAVNAAFHDPRFKPMTPKEMEKVEIEVSVLTEPKPLNYKDPDDLVKSLKANVHGVIIHKGYKSATFLPQVWKQLPSPEDFLSHLCTKAGLSSKEWQKGKLEVLTYKVQYFEEK